MVSVPTTTLLTKKSTWSTATLSLALADNVTVPLTVDPFAGAVSVTVGGVRSRTSVVKFQFRSLASAFPAKSLTLLMPPLTVTV